LINVLINLTIVEGNNKFVAANNKALEYGLSGGFVNKKMF